MEFRLPLRVYIEDTDAGGIVYYVNYMKYMERARTEYLRSLGYGKAAMLGENMFVVSDAQVKYRSPARLDDEIEATAELQQLGRAGIQFAQKIWRGTELLCEGHIKVACVDRSSMRPQRIPAEVHGVLQAAMAAQQA